MSPNYDTLYYWNGGTEAGKWVAIPASGQRLENLVTNYRQKGFATRRGLATVGAPEGRPNREELARLTHR